MGPEQLHGGTGQREDSAGVKEHRKIARLGAQEGTALVDGLKGESAVEAWLLACQAAETHTLSHISRLSFLGIISHIWA